jgi:PAS domain S-box-containing protein
MVPASLHDVNGRFVHMNAAAERASGISNGQLVGRHYTEPLLPELREKVVAQFRRAVEHGEPTDFETVFVDASGNRRGVRAQHLPLRSGDDIVGVLILAFDASAPASKSIGLAPQPQLTRANAKSSICSPPAYPPPTSRRSSRFPPRRSATMCGGCSVSCRCTRASRRSQPLGGSACSPRPCSGRSGPTRPPTQSDAPGRNRTSARGLGNRCSIH